MATLIKAPLHCRYPQDLKSNHSDSKLGLLHQTTALQPIATVFRQNGSLQSICNDIHVISSTNMQALK